MAGNGSDGSITIDTKLDNTGFEKGSAALLNAIKSLTQQIDQLGKTLQSTFANYGKTADNSSTKMQRVSTSVKQTQKSVSSLSKDINKLGTDIDKMGSTAEAAIGGDEKAIDKFAEQSGAADERIAQLRDDLAEFGNTEFETEDYAWLNQQIEKTETTLDKLLEKQDKMQAMGADQASKSWQTLQNDIQQTSGQLDSYKAKLAEMQQGGMTRFDAEEYQGVTQQIEQTSAALNKLLDRQQQMEDTGVKQNSKSWKNLQYSIEQTKKQLEMYKEERREMEDAGVTKTEAEQYLQLEQQIEKTQATLDKLHEKETKMQATGGDQESKSWQSLQYDIQQATQKLEAYKAERAEMEASGESHYAGADTNEFAQAEEALNSYENKLRETENAVSEVTVVPSKLSLSIDALKNALTGLGQTLGGTVLSGLRSVASAAKSAASSLASMVGNKISNGLSSIVSGVKKVASALTGLGKSTNSSNKSMGSSLMTMLKYGLGIRSLYSLFNKLRSAITEGFNSLASYSSSVNSSLSSMTSALSTLKNSLASAFSPIVTAVAPAITYLINLLVNAINAIGQFIAALTGSSTYIKATAVATDYASSLDSTASSASDAADAVEDLNRQTAGFDDLEILTDNSSDSSSGGSGGGGGGGSTGDLFTTEEVESAYSDLANSIKEYFSDIFQPMKDAWDTYGEGVITAWKTAFEDILELLKDIAETFRTVWTNGTGETICGNILIILTQIGQMLDSIAVAFKAAWDDNGAGEAYIQSLLDRFNSILEVIKSIGASLLTVWNNGTGEATMGNILSILTTINNLLATIRTAFVAAWNDNGTGEAYVQSIFNVLNSIISVLDTIGQSIIEVWSNGTGETIFSTTLSILTNINETVANIATNFKNAWELDGTGTAIIQGLADTLATLLGHVNNITAGLKSWASDLDFSPLLTAIKDLVEAFEPLADNVGQGLEWFFTNVAEPLAKWAIEQGIPAALDLISSALTALNAVVEAVKPFLTWLWENFLQPIASWTGGAIVTVLGWISDGLQTIADILNGNASLSDFISGIGAGISGTIQAGVSLVKDGWDTVTGWLGSLGANIVSSVISVGVSLKKKASEWSDDAWTALQSAGKTIKSTVKAAVKKASKWSDDAWTAIKTKAETVTRTLKQSVEKGETWVADAWTAVKTTAATIFRTLKQSVEKNTWIDDAWTAVKTTAATIYRSLKQSVTKNTWTDDAWEAVKTVAATIYRSLKQSVTKNTWVDDAWSAVKTAAGITARTLQQSVKKGSSWVDDAWSAACKAAGITARTFQQSVKKGSSWVADAWSAACKAAGTTARTLKQSVKKGSTWSSDAWSAAKMVSGTISKTVSVTLTTARNSVSALKSLLGLASGGIVTPVGIKPFMAGGYISASGAANWWKSVPKYASGTASAHGTAFVAGESGPEIVGHVNNRTEVLNQSQLAVIMRDAVENGMSAISAALGTAILNKMAECANAVISAILYSVEVPVELSASPISGGSETATLTAALEDLASQITFTAPAMSTGSVLPYAIADESGVSDITDTIESSNSAMSDVMVQALASAANLIVQAINSLNLSSSNSSDVQTQQIIDEINRRTVMFQSSPLKG